MTIHAIDAVVLPQALRQQIDLFLEALYEGGHTRKAGQQMVDSNMKSSQVRGLENLIVATTRFSEIINYIKNQVGKNRPEWEQAGPLLLNQLHQLEQEAERLVANNAAVRLETKLELARGWARQVVAHYLYGAKSKGGLNDRT